jgi:hypothetical protein
MTRGVLSRAVAGVLLVWGAMSVVLLTLHASDLFLLNEIGYGDSYVLHDVMSFQKTGVIYRDLSQPPYLPVDYSPLVYVLYSLPGRIATSENPFLGPRVMALASFLICVAVVLSIVRTLVSARSAQLWGLLLTCSIGSMWFWILQLRGDFPGACLSLLAIRLLLSHSRRALFLAGICAGLATLFKISFVAALTSGALWLLLQQRWKDFGRFATTGILSSAGLYLLLFAREPRMLPQMFALSPGVMDIRGCLALMKQALNERVVPLAVLGLTSLRLHGQSRWSLVVGFAVVSFVVAGLLDLQAGGNVNYFYEALFAAVPLSVLGVVRLLALARSQAIVGVVLLALLFTYFCIPRTSDALGMYRSRVGNGPESVTTRNQAFRTLEQALRGQHIMSTIPRLALLDRTPALTEPFLMTYMERLGKFDPRLILERVHNDEFDVVITSAKTEIWRGVPYMPPDLAVSIAAAYRPHCLLFGSVMHLPRQRRDSSALTRSLAGAGCTLIPAEPAASPRID